ncbi:hypothetical protein L9F63_018274 [Diploptera punctata]|uniref:Tectonic domain-containing protein n=1 Tax=Diploptera punctata TaxID=6984 RepID=A0AAD7ZX66_DIPPU|nr:hypothetical protein L9F63_018274 [Diploptera punctata]
MIRQDVFKSLKIVFIVCANEKRVPLALSTLHIVDCGSGKIWRCAERVMKEVMGGIVFVCLFLLVNSQTNTSCTDDATNSTDDVCQLVNVTELYNTTFSVDNVTELETTETTVKHETTTEATSATVEAPAEARPISNDACTCDLTMDSCDLNCCCDVECSEKDRLVFSGCEVRQQYNFDSRHCYQTNFIYHNNTEFKSVYNADGLFCIVRDNLPTRFLYHNRKIVNTLHEFNKLHRRYKSFSWPSQNMNHPTFDPSKQYKSGDIMWSIANKTLVPFNFFPISSILCFSVQTSNMMRYLHDWTGECSRTVPDSSTCETDPSLSAATYYTGFSLLSSPHLFNASYQPHFRGLFCMVCPLDVCVPATLFLCAVQQNEEACSEVSDIEYPVYNSDTRACHSVVKQVTYKIFHNGTDGLTKLHLYIKLTTTTVQTELSQKFTVSFHWTKDGNNLFHRSGNPGYVVGKPVMAGRKVTQIVNIEDEIDKEAIEVSNDPRDWLSLATADYKGECDLSRQAVTFGEDRLSSCVVPVTPTNFSSSSSCTSMHKTLLYLLAGSSIENVTSVNNFNLYVATFGDSQVEDTSDWVQVILERMPLYVVASSLQNSDWSLSCKSVVTSLHVDVMYAHVGSLAVPQAKILGVVFRFGQPHNVMYSCFSLRCREDDRKQFVKVVSSVSFIDVTKPAVTEFAEPPVYEVKLPHDFFYPFFSKSSSLYSNVTILILSLFFILAVELIQRNLIGSLHFTIF